MKHLLTVPEVADRLKVSRSHVYALINTGRLRAYNVSAKTGATKTRIAGADLDAYIAAAEMPVAS